MNWLKKLFFRESPTNAGDTQSSTREISGPLALMEKKSSPQSTVIYSSVSNDDSGKLVPPWDAKLRKMDSAPHVKKPPSNSNIVFVEQQGTMSMFKVENPKNIESQSTGKRRSPRSH